MADVHQVFSVTKTVDDALSIDIDFTGVNSGERIRAVYILRDDDGHGSAPMIREWIAANNPEILPYTPPLPATPEELRAAMQPLAKWRFDTVIDSRPGLRDKIEAAIDRNLTDPLQRAMARNKFRSVPEFYRVDSLFPLLSSDPEINISDDEIDVMWQQGLDLPIF